MAKSPEVVQQFLEEVEAAAEEVISDRQEIITLDRRRNTNREALKQLAGQGKAGDSRMWICVGNMFMRMPRGFVKDSIDKDIQTCISSTIQTYLLIILDTTALTALWGLTNASLQ
ncbi:p53 and DNA damage-regulated protein 1 [Chionoecetes opilio]|uniref:p53 and DNA damage-regulated protein 1 n=1 Tax=Chionoecetes opilio TaxID=41210 RepID=A0A8J5CJD4_CHIOP|nr:p53 and DNA damage-regulated protein 1 [Chionoecetes opilio]